MSLVHITLTGYKCALRWVTPEGETPRWLLFPPNWLTMDDYDQIDEAYAQAVDTATEHGGSSPDDFGFPFALMGSIP